MYSSRKFGGELPFDRLVIVSNRLPITLMRGRENNKWQVRQSAGGLVTALTPILSRNYGLWIGWAGIMEQTDLDGILTSAGRNIGCTLKPVMLTEDELNKYYFGFSNEVMWPLLHDLQSHCKFDPAYWDIYNRVNRKFAKVVAKNIRENDYIWIHDYHLLLLAKELRQMGIENRIGFFLHTPFPPPDIYVKMPWRTHILEALLDYDLLGFQTSRDRNNFVYCIQAVLRGIRVDTRKHVALIEMPGRTVGIGSFPISIDFKDFARGAESGTVTENVKELREAVHHRKLILGVDRLDYSKGIPEKLKAFKNALERFDDLRENATMVQIVVPSRENIPGYQELLSEIEGLVSRINGEFATLGWVPIQYMFREIDRAKLLAYYRAADIALVTPLKDGMNLVAKEYCAARVDGGGVLILSEFAGAAVQFQKDALLVNPYDIEGVADAVERAYSMDQAEQSWRMRRLRKSIATRDVFRWVDSFLNAAMNL